MAIVVHVGLHKTASTWLQERCFRPLGRLVNSTQRPAEDPTIRSLVLGRRELPPLPPDGSIVSAERLSGHPASGWSDADAIADRIASWCSDPKIIVGTRERDPWLRSIYRQLVQEGDPRPWKVMLEPGWKRPHVDIDAVSESALRSRYDSRFRSVLYLPMELLVTDPGAYVAMLADFLEADLPEDLDLAPMNARTYRNLEWRRRLNHVIRSELNPQPMVDLSWVARRVQRRFT